MSGAGDLICLRGVTPEIWKTLDELWGPELAGPLRKLPLLRNHHGPYRKCTNPPDNTILQTTRHNDKIHLVEIRYGNIDSIYDHQNCLWFVLKHAKDEHSRINSWGLLKLRVQFWKQTNGAERGQDLMNENICVQVVKATEEEDDLYVLLAMIATDPNEWNEKFLPHFSSFRIGEGERVIVQLTDSRPYFGRYREAIWQGDVHWT